MGQGADADALGTRGGEEYLSYMLHAESLVLEGSDRRPAWRTQMASSFEKVQASDGCWTGHHCITSPAFCTAAVIQCLTADRDAALLSAMVKNTAGEKGATTV